VKTAATRVSMSLAEVKAQLGTDKPVAVIRCAFAFHMVCAHSVG
jgi:hypothetical protein